jgi:uncharacterized protein
VGGTRPFSDPPPATVDATITAEDFFEAGNTVVATARTRGRVRSNDVRFDLRSVHVWTIRGAKAVGIQFYLDTPAMLAALEQAPTGD